MEEEKILQFQPFKSSVSISFWYELANKKLETYKLNDQPISLMGYYTPIFSKYGNSLELESKFYLEGETAFEDFSSFISNHNNIHVFVPGILYNTNTLESFKDLDKKTIFDNCTNMIWNDINNDKVLKEPNRLCRFLLITFADIKHYKFYYWFAFPAFSINNIFTFSQVQSLKNLFSSSQIKSLKENHQLKGYPPFFIINKIEENNIVINKLEEIENFSVKENSIFWVGFIDPSGLSTNPGWPLRNFLILLIKKWKFYSNKQIIRVICYREDNNDNFSNSIVLDVNLPKDYHNEFFLSECPKSVGWEKNPKGQFSARLVNLNSTMDPLKLADSSVDLNLKLMKWRLLPTLDLEKIKNTSCLLLGAGTLGTNVARCLMSWGIRTITFVDNGKVSFSNPVRQSLFQYEDCLNGGKYKAEIAAKRLLEIFPGMNATGKIFSIPMPGHAISNDEIQNTKNICEMLESLIESHDVTFILTDSRESRWLPTLLCSILGKLAINCALGFDSFLVIRHGIHQNNHNLPSLGCYFCSDIVAPQNSLKDRTLDQQCTVTRPGLSFIASALSVELLISILHHPQGPQAPASTDKSQYKELNSFIPHSIRGFLSQYNNILITGQAYDKCTACSNTVIEKYKKEKFEFLLKVFNNPTYLEDITGLSKMKEEDIVWEISQDDDF